MGISYRYTITLDVPFSEESILKIVHQGRQIGLFFLEQREYGDDWAELSPLNDEQIMKKIKKEISGDYDDDYPIGFAIRYKDSDFTLRVEDSSNLSIILFPLSFWYKTYEYPSLEMMDMARYADFLVDLCKDFPILSFETEQF